MFYLAMLAAGIACGFLGLLSKVAWDFVTRRKNRQRLGDRVSKWWRSGLTDAPESIEYRTREGIRKGRPVRATGQHLLVEQKGPGRETLLVSVGEAVDREAFWKAWRYFNVRLAQYVDEDGDPWEPE